MPLISRVARPVEWALKFAVGLIMASLVAIVLWGVFTRFVLNAPSWWTEEAARLLLIWLTMLGAAVASASREHLGLDYVAQRLDPQARRALALSAELIVVGFCAAVLVYGGSALVLGALSGEQLTPALGLRMGHVYLAVPIGGLAMILFSLEQIARLLRGDDPAPRPPAHAADP